MNYSRKLCSLFLTFVLFVQAPVSVFADSTVNDETRLESPENIELTDSSAVDDSQFPNNITNEVTDSEDNVTQSEITEDTGDTSYSEEDPLKEENDVEDTAETDSSVQSGRIGNTEVEWSLYDSVLTISGTGTIGGFASSVEQPWAEFGTEIAFAVFDLSNGLTVTNLSHWFEGCNRLYVCEVPYTVGSLGARAFAGCTALTVVTYSEFCAVESDSFLDCISLSNGEDETEPSAENILSAPKAALYASGGYCTTHTDTNYSVAATCTTSGRYGRTCTVCGRNNRSRI